LGADVDMAEEQVQNTNGACARFSWLREFFNRGFRRQLKLRRLVMIK